MKVLVTGKDGQVAQSLKMMGYRFPALDLIFVGRPEFDLAEPDTIHHTIQLVKPDVIVSAAAYTAVDLAEDEPDKAHRINATAPGHLAKAAAEIGAKLIHLSTDYVFDGTLERPYAETDQVNPISAYGKSKLAGEQAIADTFKDFVILRTAWVYSPFGKNFMKTMMSLAETRNELNVVDDQAGNPTSAFDIANGILSILDIWQSKPDTGLGEVYHLTGNGETTWCRFARMIFQASGKAESVKVNDITTADFPTKAKRPANSRMNCDKFQRDFGFRADTLDQAIMMVLDFQKAVPEAEAL